MYESFASVRAEKIYAAAKKALDQAESDVAKIEAAYDDIPYPHLPNPFLGAARQKANQVRRILDFAKMVSTEPRANEYIELSVDDFMVIKEGWDE